MMDGWMKILLAPLDIFVALSIQKILAVLSEIESRK
jgi:hypothetical protein